MIREGTQFPPLISNPSRLNYQQADKPIDYFSLQHTMQCEICGKYIDKGKRVRVEGSTIITCEECSRYGEVVGVASSYEVKKPAPIVGDRKEASFEVKEDELIDDYSEIIRKTRECRGMTQEELAKSVNEPASLVHRIETGRIEPSLQIARKLEKKLGIRLFQESGALDINPVKTKIPDELTLGDLVVIKKREKRG